MLLLPEREMGKAWELSKKQCFFGYSQGWHWTEK
jgi:hypothetical protein